MQKYDQTFQRYEFFQHFKKLVEILSTFLGTGGVITIDKDGNVGKAFTTNKMAWAYQKCKELKFGIRAGKEESEEVSDYEFDFD